MNIVKGLIKEVCFILLIKETESVIYIMKINTAWKSTKILAVSQRGTHGDSINLPISIY